MIERLTFTDTDLVYGMTLANKDAWTSRGFCVAAMSDVPMTDTLACRRELQKELGFQTLITQKQVHGSAMQWVDADSACDIESDALICAQPGVLLCASVADCEGIVLYHPSRKVCAVVHSGWRGTQLNIVASVVQSICENLSVAADELHAWCSPCASGRNYEVQDDVQIFFPNYCQPTTKGRYLFDNQLAVVDQLLNVGLRSTNIARSELCTMEEKSMHSFRRDGQAAGRMAVFVGYRETEETI